jgi:hypothetical protein
VFGIEVDAVRPQIVGGSITWVASAMNVVAYVSVASRGVSGDRLGKRRPRIPGGRGAMMKL